MSTALAAQLAQLAASSKSTLDVKAARAAHSRSLIFEPRIAASQSYQTLFSICREGFDELCRLDHRFGQFRFTLFSEQSRDEDRSQMTAAENAELDKRIESFLHRVASRIRLMPAIKAIEWLVRRFRIHEYNTALLITTFLPYYSIPAFVTLLDILPAEIPHEYRFLDPYIRSKTSPPKAIFVHQATNHRELLATISEYTLESCRRQQQFDTLISFWFNIMTLAVSGMLEKHLSGRRSVLKDNLQALMHQIGPILSEGLAMTKVPKFQIACYAVTLVLVSKGGLEDDIIVAFMEHIVSAWTSQTVREGLVCLSHLAQSRSQKQLPKKVSRALRKISGLLDILSEIAREHQVEKLCFGMCLNSIERLHKKGESDGLSMVEVIMSKQMLSEQQLMDVFKSLVQAVGQIGDEQTTARDALTSTVVGLSQTTTGSGEIFFRVIQEMGIDIEQLELRLGTQIHRKEISNESFDEVKPSDVQVPATTESFDRGVRRLAESSATPAASCLVSPSPPDIFTELCFLYMSAISDPKNLSIFEKLEPMQRSQLKTPFYFSFLARIWCGPYPTLARQGALDMAKDRVNADDCKKFDFQALVPYCIAALSDPSRKVRRAAADLISVLESSSAAYTSSLVYWGTGKLYNIEQAVGRLSAEVLRKLLHNILLPTLEECVLNEDHIHVVIQSVLGSSSSRVSLDGIEMDKKSRISHGARLSVLTFLAQHAVHTPLLAVKLRLLRPLNTVKKVSDTSRTKLLLQLLKDWVSLSAEEASTISREQNIDQSSMDQSAVETVVPNDKKGLDFLLGSVQLPEMSARQSLIQAIFERIAKMWPSMKSDMKADTAKKLLQIAQESSSGFQDAVAGEAATLLSTLKLTTEILLDFLSSLQSVAKTASEPPTSKRRRTSSSDLNRGVPTEAPSDFTLTLKQVTFVLQLVEGSEPGNHPELLDSLFSTLSQLQEFRTVLGSELGYLQNLVLSSLLAMVPAYKDNNELKIKDSLGYGDLLAACIQKSSSPSVQNTALLLLAGLAKVDPDLVLHCAMPIFTFMGSSVLRQSDDYSAHVINQTIKEVVPRLIESLRKGKKSPVAGARELLVSFVASFEHIPQHRRLGLFVSLVDTLGPGDFLFALLAMLVDKFESTIEVLSFASDVFNHFTAEVQLQSLVKLLNLIADLYELKPYLSAELLGKEQDADRDAEKIALVQLDLVPQLLSSKKLSTQITKMTNKDDMDAAKVRELYSTLLEDLLSLAEKLRPYKALHNRCGDALPKLLNLLSVGEFIKAVDTLLDRPDPVIRRKVLRALDIRIDRENQSDADSRAALLAFVPQLTAIIRVSDDMTYKTLAVQCVDKIAEKYGKKDPEAVTAAAATISSDQCLGQNDSHLRVTALLCLSSLVDVLQDEIVPVLPTAIPKCLTYIKESFGDGKVNGPLHNAGYSFLTALTQHLPYIMSKSYLEQLLLVSSASAASELDDECNASRLDCLRSLAKQVDAKVMFYSLESSWDAAVASGFPSLKEYLDILGLAIDKRSKTDISKNVGSLSKICLAAFDFRRLEHSRGNAQNTSARNLSKIEELVNGVVLRMVYKLNDASFRPIFSQLMDWAVSLPKSDSTGRNLRLLGVFGFLHAFFDSLKSIVTSYTAYIIDAAVDVLKSTNPSLKDIVERELWKKAVNTLAKTFEHDQDSFWQAPSHFGAVAPTLTAQFAHATSGVDLSHDLVPAIVELAAAADSQEHQKELNSALLKHLRSEHAVVRLAVVVCQQKLAERLGEEWLAMLPEMLPYISELQEDDDENVERETARWIVGIEGILGESLDAMLQ